MRLPIDRFPPSQPTRGERLFADMSPVSFDEVLQVGSQCAVAYLWHDAAMPRLRRALVAPCTTTIRSLLSEVVLEPADDPIPQRSAVNLDSVESVSLAVLVERLGRLADARMREICAALAVAVDCQT